MGMFDTFHIEVGDRHLAVQSKQFANALSDYWFGDFVEFASAPPRGVQAYLEDHKQDWSDPECPLEWVVLLLVNGCFLDAYVSGDKADAQQAAEAMAQLWQAPERQAHAFQHHARAHFNARIGLQRSLDGISCLLRDYAAWQEHQTNKEAETGLFGLLRHDFNRESWDWAIARVLLALPGYREQVPASYVVAKELDKARPDEGNSDEG